MFAGVPDDSAVRGAGRVLGHGADGRGADALRGPGPHEGQPGRRRRRLRRHRARGGRRLGRAYSVLLLF